MSKITIVIGLLLIAIGVAGYMLPSTEVVEEGTETVVEQKRSITALIPAVVGAPLLICGLATVILPNQKKHFMHAAVLIGLLGALAATGRGASSLLKFIRGDEFNGRAAVFLALMGVLCWIFVISCVNSFIQARKAREAEEAKSAT